MCCFSCQLETFSANQFLGHLIMPSSCTPGWQASCRHCALQKSAYLLKQIGITCITSWHT